MQWSRDGVGAKVTHQARAETDSGDGCVICKVDCAEWARLEVLRLLALSDMSVTALVRTTSRITASQGAAVSTDGNR